jgi:hypothetical protein
MSSLLIDNRKIIDGIVATSGVNTNVWYQREQNDSFTINGAYIGAESVFDWVLTKTTNSRTIKAGVQKLSNSRRMVNISFDTSFPDNNYYLYYLSNNNVNIRTVEKKSSNFTIASSWDIGEEVTWLAIHREFASKTGINNPGTIFAGQRGLTGETPSVTGDTLNIEDPDQSNLNTWYNGEYIIQPNEEDDFITQLPNLEEYSIILTADININTYWIEKAADRFKIGSSYDQSCIIDYLMIKKGIDWWNEF